MAPASHPEWNPPDAESAPSHTRLLLDLGFSLSEASTEEQVAEIILEAADRLLGWDSSFVTAYSADEDLQRSIVSFDIVGGVRSRIQNLQPPSRPSAFSRPIIDGHPVILLRESESDLRLSNLPLFGDSARRSLSLLYAPLRMEGRTVGFLSIQSYRRHAYTKSDLDLLQALANHCAGAMRRTWAETALRKSKEELEETVRERTAHLVLANKRLVDQVDETRRAEEEASRSRDALREVVATAGGIVYEWRRATGLFQFLNDPGSVFHGLRPGESDHDSLCAMLRRTGGADPSSARGDICRTDEAFLLANGATRWFSHTAIPLRDGSGTLGFLLDITERRAAEERDRDRRRMEMADLQEENRFLRRHIATGELARPEAFARIVTESRVMRAILLSIESIATTPQPILIAGETGTGKELVAEAIHLSSGRKGSFVCVNVAGLDDEALTDALFGHVKGAFTGATRSREGLVRKAAAGTLFLDEIGDLTARGQLKLLRLLQEREFYPLGADKPQQATCRFVAATNRDLEDLVARGVFREDLYYRLASHLVQLPPLRSRRSDIPVLCRHFLAASEALLGHPLPPITPECEAILCAHDWRGNVRELEGILADFATRVASAGWDAAELRARIGGTVAENPASDAGGAFPTLKTLCDRHIEDALRRCGGNQARAAILLGITQQALNSRVKTMLRRGWKFTEGTSPRKRRKSRER